MCKIDFSTTFLNKSFPHWLYDVLFVYGNVVYAIVSFLQDERNNTCFTRGHGLSLIHISEPTRLGMISYAVFCLKKKKTYSYIVCRLLLEQQNVP